jgi:hypothetical protein
MPSPRRPAAKTTKSAIPQISWRAPQDRDRAFYRGLAAAALVEWLTVGALIWAHEKGLLTISREVAAALCISGAFGARYFAKRRTQQVA